MKKLSSRITTLLRKVSLRKRLFTTFIALSILPAFIIGVFSFNVYTDSIEQKVSQSAEQTIKMMNTTIDVELSKYTSFIGALSVSDEIQTALSSPPSVPFVRDSATSQLLARVINYNPLQSRYLKNMRIVDRDGNVLYELGFDDISAQTYEDVLSTIDERAPQDSLQYVRTYRGARQVVLGRKLYTLGSNGQSIGYILLYIDEALFSNQLFSGITFGDNSSIFYIDETGQVIASQDQSYLGDSVPQSLWEGLQKAAEKGEVLFRTSLEGADHLVVFNQGKTFNTYALAVIPYSYLLSETHQITISLVLLVAFLIAFCMLLAYVIYRSISQPIQKMVLFCDGITSEGLYTDLPEIGTDELGKLGDTINHMLGEIRLLIKNWEKDQKQKRDLELEMLQYQINPHFLFNTLNTLKWVSVMNDVPVLTEGITALSGLLKNTLLTKEEFISIRQETENLTSYFSIQKIRYGDSFTVTQELDEALMENKIPRFILQPLAENAILHGTAGGEIKTNIIVRCRMQQTDILLEIEDDGPGFDTAVLEDGRKKGEAYSGIGTANVAERLLLYYGENYGLTVHSTPGQGTVCSIRIPSAEKE